MLLGCIVMLTPTLLLLLLLLLLLCCQVYPGPEGKARFQQQIRELVKLRDDEEFEVEFECKAPDSGVCAWCVLGKGCVCWGVGV